MARDFRTALIAFVFMMPSTLLVTAGEAEERVQSFRQAFEKRMNAELDEHGRKARDLREKYLEALNRLKAELGRDEKLKGAAQVLAEIEAVEDGEMSTPLPADADYRHRRVRKTWEDGLAEILRERSAKLKATVDLYLKALDSEKRKLTRAGKIKDALLFEEEEKRVKELPEVKAVLAEAPKPPGELDLGAILPGRKYSYIREEAPERSLTLAFDENGRASITPGTADVRWRITNDRSVVLSHPDWSTRIELDFVKDASSYRGKPRGKDVWRRGTLLNDSE